MKKLLKWFIILIPVFVVILFLLIAALIPNKAAEVEKKKEKEFITKDNRVVLKAYEDFKQEDKGEYDLYLNKNKTQILGLFTYYLSEYEENSSKEILDHQTNAFINTRKDMKIWKKEYKIEMDDKTITKVEYIGKTDKSSDCIYIFATIDFKADPNYVVYVNEVILKDDYENNIGEMNNILQSAKLK